MEQLILNLILYHIIMYTSKIAGQDSKLDVLKLLPSRYENKITIAIFCADNSKDNNFIISLTSSK